MSETQYPGRMMHLQIMPSEDTIATAIKFGAIKEESIPIIDCKPGDLLRGRFGHNWGASSIILVRVKVIPGGRAQIKYQSAYQWGRKAAKVLKANVRADLMVLRTPPSAPKASSTIIEQ